MQHVHRCTFDCMLLHVVAHCCQVHCARIMANYCTLRTCQLEVCEHDGARVFVMYVHCLHHSNSSRNTLLLLLQLFAGVIVAE
jgi:hypothetical protein